MLNDIKENFIWLQNNQAPWETVVEKWSKTIEYRFSLLMNVRNKTLQNVFAEWPLYKHPNGYKLIDYDFYQMQLSDLTLTITKWNDFFTIIKNNTSSIGKNDDFLELIEKLNLDLSEGNLLYHCTQYKYTS